MSVEGTKICTTFVYIYMLCTYIKGYKTETKSYMVILCVQQSVISKAKNSNVLHLAVHTYNNGQYLYSTVRSYSLAVV